MSIFQVNTRSSFDPDSEYIVTSESNHTESVGDVPSQDGIDLVFDADYQHHLIRRTSPIQSATFDKQITVSLRPQALVIASAVLQQESARLIDREYGASGRYQLGDLIDTSNVSEWIVYLLAGLDEDQFEQIFDVADADRWSERQWKSYFEHLDELDRQDFLDRVVEIYESSGERILAGPEGNHDGAAWGNGLEHSLSLFQLETKIIQYTTQRNQLEGRIRRYQKLLEQGQLSKRKKERYEARVAKFEREIFVLESRLQRALEEQPESQKHYVYSRQKDFIQRRIDRLIRRLDGRHLTPRRREALESRIQILERRLEFVEEKLDATIRERDRVREENRSKKFSERFNLFRPIANVFMGITRNRSLHDPHGYWAMNSGGVEANFDKNDYLDQYLRTRYPELFSEENGVEAMSSYIVDLDESRRSRNEPSMKVSYVPEESIEPLLSSHADVFPRDVLSIGGSEEARPQDIYHAFWKEIHPGEYMTLVDVGGDENGGSHRKFLIQAFYEGEVNGKAVYHIILDGMDLSEDIADIAYFSSMSHIQRYVAQAFLDQMRAKHSDEVMFMHSSHYPVRSHVHKMWKKAGWPDYFTQSDVIPFLFSGHGHMRAQYDETQRTFFGKPIFFGNRYVKDDDPFYSLMTPSTTDAPNEFMSIDLDFDESSEEYVLRQQYHTVGQDVRNTPVDPDVAARLDDVRPLISPQRYQRYAEVKTGFFPGVANILFSQDHIYVKDAIPISIGNFRETLTLADHVSELLKDEFGSNDALVRLVGKSLSDMKRHFARWMYGDPDSDNEYDKMGYLQAKDIAEDLRRRQDEHALMLHYNDVFDTPSYERYRYLMAQIPDSSKAYQFLLLLGLEAAENEVSTVSGAPLGKRHQVPDESEFRFTLD